MAPAIVSVIAFFVLIAWRFVLAGPHHRLLARAIAPQRQRHNHLLEEGLQISDPGSVAVIAENQFENNSGGLQFSTKRIAQKPICGASLPSQVPRNR
jgi:hypothetical protein